MPDSDVLPTPGGTGEQQVVGGLPPPAGGLEHHGQVLLELPLAHEVGQAAGAEAGVLHLLPLVGRRRVEELVTHDAPPGP